MVKQLRVMEKKLTSSGPFRESVDKHSIYTIQLIPTPDRSPTVQVNIKNLIDDVQCYQTVRELRWPEGIACPSCASKHVIKRGFDDTEPARQRYECHDCDQRFDDGSYWIPGAWT